MSIKRMMVYVNVFFIAALVWTITSGIGNWYQNYVNWWMNKIPGWFKAFGFLYSPEAIRIEMIIAFVVILFGAGLCNGLYIGRYKLKDE